MPRSKQLQIDVYGEIMDALHHGRHGKLGASEEGWDLQRGLARTSRDNLGQARSRHLGGARRSAALHQFQGHGLGRFRSRHQDREHFKLEGPVERWRKLREAVHDESAATAFNPELGAFTQSYGSKQLDASALLIALVGFLPPQDPRVKSTVEAIKKHLVVDGLVRRYDSAAGIDGLPPGEGVFLPCSFWLADNLILLGRRDEARALFERLLSLA